MGGVAGARRVRTRVSSSGGGGSGEPPNRSQVATVVCVPLTGNLVWAAAPGNTLLRSKATGLPRDSVANASQIISLDRSFLVERVARLTPKGFAQILYGIEVILGR